MPFLVLFLVGLMFFVVVGVVAIVVIVIFNVHAIVVIVFVVVFVDPFFPLIKARPPRRECSL